MRILIIGINFPPELVSTGKYTGEMAAYLVEQGHDVRVVTAPPYYPWWRVQPPYRWWQYRRESWRGVDVCRCPLWVSKNTSGAKRLLHLLSFALSSASVLLGLVFWKWDVVICVAPAFFSAPFALLTARLSGAKAWLHIQDFELDAATNLGMLSEGNILSRVLAWGEKWLLKRFDVVSTISRRMLSRLLDKGVAPARAHLLINWVDTQKIFPLPDEKQALRGQFGIPVDKFVALYSGNMGRKQGLEHVLAAARQLEDHGAIHFVLCGDGAVRDELLAQADDLPNVQFLPLQPVDKLNDLLNTADVHLLPQRADAADLVMPSKLSGMLASGIAVIATARPGTEVAQVVGEVGLVVPPESSDALAGAILELSQKPKLRTELGGKGRAYAQQYWDQGKVLDDFSKQLISVLQEK